MSTTAGVSGSRLKLRVSVEEGATVVRCSGRLKAADAAIFKAEIKGLIPNAKRMVLDLTDLTFVDSSGLGAIVTVYASSKTAGCEMQLVNLSQQLRELMRFTRVLSLFEARGQYHTRIPEGRAGD